MKKLSETEMLSLREMLQSETNSLIKQNMMKPMVTDDQLKRYLETAIVASEARIKGIQQFIHDNQVINIREVH